MGPSFRRSVRLLALLAVTALSPVVAPLARGPFAGAATPPLAIATTALPEGTLASTYTVPLTATGGVPPYSWSIAQGPIPAGLVLSSLGILSGRPGSLGSVSVVLKVTDSTGAVATRSLGFTVVTPPPPPEELFAVSPSGLLTLTAPGGVPAVLPDGPSLIAPVAVVDVAANGAGTGAWVLTVQGTIIPVGSAVSYGSPARHRGADVALAADAAGTGYWVVTSTGRVSGFGSARQRGSVPRGARSGRVVAIAAAPHGLGYWIATSTGRVYAFGSARTLGSLRRRSLRGRIVGIAAARDGTGYWLASTSGDVYSFGTVRTSHFAGAVKPNAPVTAIAASPSGIGYWLLTGSGAVFAFGSAEALAPSTALLVGSPVVAASGAP